jgi:hypothetical protein
VVWDKDGADPPPDAYAPFETIGIKANNKASKKVFIDDSPKGFNITGLVEAR